jgi:hypothetical protein
MIQLPHKLSELAQIALDDVTEIENTPGYTVAMESWHTPGSASCEVCAAGSVMVCHFGLQKEDYICLGVFEKLFGGSNTRALLAIDCLRRGFVSAAQQVLIDRQAWITLPLDDYDDPHEVSRPMPDYDDNPASWHSEMAQLIADLRAAGL